MDIKVKSMEYKRIIVGILILYFSVCSCKNFKADKSRGSDVNSGDYLATEECLLYGHSLRVDAFSGPTILIEKPSNRREKLVYEILNREELVELQSNISKSGSNDFVALSICDLAVNPIEAEVIVDNYYGDSLIFKVEIDTLKAVYKVK